MIQATSFVNGQLDHLLDAWSQAKFAQDDVISPTNNKFNGATNFMLLYTKVTQNFRSNALAFSHKPEQKMFCPDIIVLEALGLFLSKTQDFSCSLCKLVKPISIVHLFVTPLSVAEGGTEPSVMLR